MKLVQLRAALLASPRETRPTLAALGLCSDPGGIGRTTVSNVAELSGQDRRTVQRHLRRLEAEGRVVVVERPTGQRAARRQIVVADLVDNYDEGRHGVPSNGQPRGGMVSKRGGMVSSRGGVVPPNVSLDLERVLGAAAPDAVVENLAAGDDEAEYAKARDTALSQARAAIAEAKNGRR